MAMAARRWLSTPSASSSSRVMRASSVGLVAPRAFSVTVPAGAVPVMKDGAQVYQHVCQGCHMAEGQGAHGAGAYPALSTNPKLGAKVYPVYMVASGQGGMPGFKKYMDDQQIAAVVNYVRTHFGNQYPDTVTAEEVRVLTQR